MVMAAQLSNIDLSEFERLLGLLKRAGLPVAAPSIAAADMLTAMGMDKKVHGKQLRFVLLESLGRAFITSEYDNALLERILGTAN